MITVANSDIAEKYCDKFDNYPDVAHPAVFAEPAFGELMQRAIDRGTALTQPEVDQQFGEQSWEW